MVELWACRRCEPVDLQRRSASESWTFLRPAPDQTRPSKGGGGVPVGSARGWTPPPPA